MNLTDDEVKESELFKGQVLRLFGISLCHSRLEALIKYDAGPDEWDEVQKAIKEAKVKKTTKKKRRR